jgi:uncharacterized membrane protein
MGRSVQEKNIHAVFKASVLIKGVNALLECIGGIAVALARADEVAAWVARMAQTYLVEGTHGFVASHVIDWAQSVSIQTQHFIAFYLLSHGLIKLVIVVGLFKEQRWSYPLALVAFTGFIVYQLYRYSYTHGVGLLVLTAFDLFLIALVWHEYKLIRHNLPTR